MLKVSLDNYRMAKCLGMGGTPCTRRGPQNGFGRPQRRTTVCERLCGAQVAFSSRSMNRGDSPQSAAQRMATVSAKGPTINTQKKCLTSHGHTPHILRRFRLMRKAAPNREDDRTDRLGISISASHVTQMRRFEGSRVPTATGTSHRKCEQE
jgi:hypothetical protein